MEYKVEFDCSDPKPLVAFGCSINIDSNDIFLAFGDRYGIERAEGYEGNANVYIAGFDTSVKLNTPHFGVEAVVNRIVVFPDSEHNTIHLFGNSQDLVLFHIDARRNPTRLAWGDDAVVQYAYTFSFTGEPLSEDAQSFFAGDAPNLFIDGGPGHDSYTLVVDGTTLRYEDITIVDGPFGIDVKNGPRVLASLNNFEELRLVGVEPVGVFVGHDAEERPIEDPSFDASEVLFNRTYDLTSIDPADLEDGFPLQNLPPIPQAAPSHGRE